MAHMVQVWCRRHWGQGRIPPPHLCQRLNAPHSPPFTPTPDAHAHTQAHAHTPPKPRTHSRALQECTPGSPTDYESWDLSPPGSCSLGARYNATRRRREAGCFNGVEAAAAGRRVTVCGCRVGGTLTLSLSLSLSLSLILLSLGEGGRWVGRRRGSYDAWRLPGRLTLAPASLFTLHPASPPSACTKKPSLPYSFPMQPLPPFPPPAHAPFPTWSASMDGSAASTAHARPLKVSTPPCAW